MNEDIKTLAWISKNYASIDRIERSYDIITYINQKETAGRYSIKLTNSILYLPDGIIYYIDKCAGTPLKHIFNELSPTFNNPAGEYDLSKEHNDSGIIISLIIINSGDNNAFSFINPKYLPDVYRFIEIYFPDYEKYLSYSINRIINASLEDISQDATTTLFCLYNYISEYRYPQVKTAIGYSIWKQPFLAKEYLEMKKIELTDISGVCHKNINWSDVYSTILVILYCPAEEIKKLQICRTN